MYTQAIARMPGQNFAEGLTTTVSIDPPRYDLLLAQHAAYIEALKAAELAVTVLDPLTQYPDAYFVEDTAVVTPEVAVITHPGADARKGEERSMAEVLAEYREVKHIRPPGTTDGGDVLQVGRHFFIGLSQRTNRNGAEQLGRILERYGCTWETLEVGAGLHLKSSVNYVGKKTLLVTADFAKHARLAGYEKIVVDAEDAYSANALLVNERLLIPAGFPGTRKKLEVLGFDIIELEASEMRKMDGGLTCMSIRL